MLIALYCVIALACEFGGVLRLFIRANKYLYLTDSLGLLTFLRNLPSMY